MPIAPHDLQLAHLWIVYPGNEVYDLNEKIIASPLREAPALQRVLNYSPR